MEFAMVSARRSDWYKHYLLAVLLVAYIVNVMDRQVLSILLQDIKVEFALTDTQLGLLGGLAFAFFYSFMGIPIARMVDRGNKGKILAGCILLWSIATVLCGASVGFLTLLLARVGTAIGEAGGSPASHTLISEHFAGKGRVTALSIFALGIPLGSIIGNLSSGYINEFYDWRYAFAAVGAPGVIVAALVYFTIDDESKDEFIQPKNNSQVSVIDTCKFLWSQRAYVHLCLAAALHSVAYYAGSTWNASFLIRSHNLSSSQAGAIIATFSVVALLGTFLGGYLSDKLASKYQDQRWTLWLPAYAILLMIPFQFYSYLSADLNNALISFCLMMLFATTFFGPSYAATQSLARKDIRAMASAILLFTQTLIGLGLGPLLVGIISDHLQPKIGVSSLSYALVIVGLVNILSVYHYFIGSRTYRDNIATASTIEDLPQQIGAAQMRRRDEPGGSSARV